ncbi:MAG: sigma-70 family RNA polymerase sigma factor [Planctomycetota bacterium]|nr:sigma-70 family RNA polymerase sigma factor [Planctomycetota bacterium]
MNVEDNVRVRQDKQDANSVSSDVNASGPDLAGLLSRAAGGDAAAWRGLIDLYGRRVYAMVKSRVGGAELAEEITQSVFATIAVKLARQEYVEQGRFEPWLFRVAMNRVRDEARRARRQASPTPPEALRHLEADGVSGDDIDAGEGRVSLLRLRLAVEELGPADREIIGLRHHGGMNFKDIASMLDQPLGTVLARHHRALRKLREILESQRHRQGDAREEPLAQRVEEASPEPTLATRPAPVPRPVVRKGVES